MVDAKLVRFAKARAVLQTAFYPHLSVHASGRPHVFHVVPQAAAPGADRSRGTEADEIRLFYVAVTQVQKFLAFSYSPDDSQMYRARSQFFDFTTRNSYILTVPISPSQSRLEPRVQAEDITRD